MTRGSTRTQRCDVGNARTRLAEARKLLDVAELVADEDIQASPSAAASLASSPVSPRRTRRVAQCLVGDRGRRITTTPSSWSARSSPTGPERLQPSGAYST
jgi:hypothetical protein